jgi:hypothetical protein
MQRLRPWIALAFVLLLAACASPGRRATPPLDAPAVVAWLQARADALSGGTPVDVRVLDGDAIQGQLEPDGTLTLHRGLLVRLRDESEATFVIAHELAHRELGHFEQRATDPAWDADAAEHAADRRALEVLQQMGLRPDAGTSLLSALAGEFEAVPDVEVQARETVAKRLELLWEFTPPAHAGRDDDPWRRVVDPEWERWFARDPAAADPGRTALVRGHVRRAR